MRPLLPALAIVALSCRPAPRLAPVASAPPPVDEALVAEDDWVVALMPGIHGAIRAVGFTDDEALVAAVGGVRVEIRDEHTSIAERVLAEPIDDLAGFDAGFYFVAKGQLFFTATFTGVDHDAELVPICWSVNGRRHPVSFPRPPEEPGDRHLDAGAVDPSEIELTQVWTTWLLVTVGGDHRLLRLREGGLSSEPLWSERAAGAISAGPWLARGELYAIVERAQAPYLVRRELGGDTTVVRPLPPGVKEVASASANRWFAVGTNLAEVWGSTDGGAHWKPLPLPREVDGDPSRAAVVPRAFCAEDVCAAPPIVWASPEVIGDYASPTLVAIDPRPEPSAVVDWNRRCP